MFETLKVFRSGRAVVLFCLYAVTAALTSPVLSQTTRITGAQTRILTNVQNGSTYAVTSSDCGKLLSLSNANGVAVTLPPAGASGLAAGCWVDIQNIGTGTAVLATSGSLIDGGGAISLTSNQGLRLVSNGADFYTQRGQGSGSGSGDSLLTVQSNGVSLGASSTLNVVAGTGVTCIPQVNAGVTALQCNADTSYIATNANLQGPVNPQLCSSFSLNGAAYLASCATTLAAYATKQTLFWYADATNTGTTPTLNIDTLGARPLVKQDGTALAVNDIKAAALYRIWYDGTNFRVVEAGLGGGGGSSSGSSSSSNTGSTSGSVPFCRVWSSASIAALGGGWSPAYIPFDTQTVACTAGMHSTSANSTQIVIPTSGVYTISCIVDAHNNGNSTTPLLRFDGDASKVLLGLGSIYSYVQLTTTREFASGEYVECGFSTSTPLNPGNGEFGTFMSVVQNR
jgi:hypothetical protein